MAAEESDVPTDLGAEVEEGKLTGDVTDAKPDRRGRFLLFGYVTSSSTFLVAIFKHGKPHSLVHTTLNPLQIHC